MKTFNYFLCFDIETKQPGSNFEPLNLFGLTNLFTIVNLNLFKNFHLHVEKELDTHSKDTQTISTQENQSPIHYRCRFSCLESQEENHTFFNHIEKKLNPNTKEIFWHLTYNQNFAFMTYSRKS